MEKIFDSEFIKEAFTISNPNPQTVHIPEGTPLESPFAQFTNPAEKQEEKGIFGIKVTPLAIAGAITGALIGKAKSDRAKINAGLPTFAPQQSEPQKIGYQEQMQKLIKNLRVLFTPISAVYIVKDGGRDITLDVIETSEMTEEMHKAWETKNDIYFKNLMLNKMHSEIQFAEKAFAKKILEGQMKMMNKTASFSDSFDMTDQEMDFYSDVLGTVMAKSSEEISEKLASLSLKNAQEDCEEYVLAEARLDRPFDKYAGIVADTLDFISPTKRKEAKLQRNLMDPKWLRNNATVGFFPDRVIFAADNKLIGTLPIINMNEEGYNRFSAGDADYFKEFLYQESRKGLARIGKKEDMEKDASEESVATLSEESIFYEAGIHPVVYFLKLTQKYGFEWVDFSSHAIMQMIEKDFALKRPIDDIALNKILSIKIANSGDKVYLNRHAFEKVVRSFNDKPVDFMERETDDLDLQDFAIALDALNRVTPYDNVYDNFSPEVYNYMAQVLADKENYIWGINISGTDEEMSFITLMNYTVLDKLNKKFLAAAENDNQISDIIDKNERIFNLALQLLDMFNEFVAGGDSGEIAMEKIRAVSSENVREKDVTEIAIKQVAKAAVIDSLLGSKESDMLAQINSLGIKF
jgi:hypothetical protein